jgi:hypothetical protein
MHLFTASVKKAYNAADFSEIDELADDEETNYERGLKFLSQDNRGMCIILTYCPRYTDNCQLNSLWFDQVPVKLEIMMMIMMTMKQVFHFIVVSLTHDCGKNHMCHII